jgi:hypothetical protein
MELKIVDYTVNRADKPRMPPPNKKTGTIYPLSGFKNQGEEK